MSATPTRDAVRGCLLGGAVGDALGWPVEFETLAAIRARFGALGVREMETHEGRHRDTPPGEITDDTQMTLFTADGLIRWRLHGAAGGSLMASIHAAYLRWLVTQGGRTRIPFARDGWLLGLRPLHQRRAPGNTCLDGLRAATGLGEPPIARNDSKGCGGAMRVAPLGLAAADPGEAFATAAAAAALTHGHPSGYLAAGHFAVLVWGAARGMGIAAVCRLADDELASHPHAAETAAAVAAARALAAHGPPSPEALETLGGGWVAEEAVGIALCCALVHSNDFAAGVRLAVNHSGDADSTCAMTGNLLGARLGEALIPARWLAVLELRDAIGSLADDLHALLGGTLDPAAPATLARYPGP